MDIKTLKISQHLQSIQAKHLIEYPNCYPKKFTYEIKER